MHNIHFYTLLYIDPNETRQLRGKNRSGDERIKIFLRNAAMLNKSLIEFGRIANPLTILTNEHDLIARLSDEIGYQDYDILEIPFSLNVPKGIKFYSAHYKIDAYKYLSTLDSERYSVLVDNDIVLLNDFPQEFFNIAEAGIPICYRLQGYDIDRIMKDTRKISPDTSVVEWCGGEFMSGKTKFWKELYERCVNIAPSYFSSLDKDLFHVGDEMLTSLAIAEMTDNGMRLLDAGTMNIIRRFWGANEDVSIKKLKASLIHLPADKVWIASKPLNSQFTPPEFIKSYSRYMRIFKFISRLKSLLH
ncbi:hypothetical protein EEL51_11455 [Muribaculaceae bacterium Isolate-110 (HZI)]|nr:hypothetical protein EEL51_11455 [Muribaculaceae bacterium Isolate-110 (HZI)]